MKFETAEILDVQPEGDGAVAVTFAVDMDWRPGQFVTLRAEIDGEDLRRSYSIAACPGDPLTVGIRAVPGGVFSTWAQTLRPGDTVDLAPPDGRFCLRGEKTLLLVAAGSGITPIIALAQAALETGAAVTLVFGNRSSKSIMFRRRLDALKDRHLDQLRLVHVLSREAQDVPALNGRVDLAKLANSGVIETDFEGAYLCGPGEMIDGCRSALMALGMAEDRIHSERFLTGPGDPAPARVEPVPDGARVDVILDGVTQSFALSDDDPNVVEAAARSGVELPWSCKGGMCCTCRCRVAEGAADMAVNYSLEQWELEAGFILACQAKPKTKTLVLDFDAT